MDAAVLEQPGVSILVKHEGFPLYHERVLIARVDPSRRSWAILTPDDDCYIEGPDFGQILIGKASESALRPAEGRPGNRLSGFPD